MDFLSEVKWHPNYLFRPLIEIFVYYLLSQYHYGLGTVEENFAHAISYSLIILNFLI